VWFSYKLCCGYPSCDQIFMIYYFVCEECRVVFWARVSCFSFVQPLKLLTLHKVSTEPGWVTPPGVHAFSPAASSMGNWIVVATWQASTQHVEIFDLQTKKFVKLQQMRIITTLLFLRPQMKSGTTDVEELTLMVRPPVQWISGLNLRNCHWKICLPSF
jgi:hypothetical protein